MVQKCNHTFRCINRYARSDAITIHLRADQCPRCLAERIVELERELAAAREMCHKWQQDAGNYALLAAQAAEEGFIT
jgi:hypothetical protein